MSDFIESTWQGTNPLNQSDLDHFVSLCDAAQFVRHHTIEWTPESRIPFGAFPSTQQQSLTSIPSPTTFPRSLLHGTPLKDEEAFLFQHYVNHVAFMMMPYEDLRNPWKSSYPAVALHYTSQSNQSLFKALLAQAAYNLAYLDCGRERMLNLAARYYASALGELRNGLLDQHKDYGALMASIMTLVMVEVCFILLT